MKAQVYTPLNPIDTFFNSVEDLVALTDAVGIPYMHQQSIGIAYVILNKTRCYCTDICDWNRCPDIEKTWIAFKTHFCRAHKELCEMTNLTLDDATRQWAYLVQQVINRVQWVLEDSSPTDEPSDIPPEPVLHQANLTSQNLDLAPQLLQ